MTQTLPPATAPCKYFDVCKLPASFNHPTGAFCILHLPDPGKNIQEFEATVRQHLSQGRSDFRYVYFRKGSHANFDKVTFPGLADFRDAVIPAEYLLLREASMPLGLTVTGESINAIFLEKATVGGPVDIRVGTVPGGIQAYKAKFSGDISIRITEAGGLDLRSELGGRVTVRGRYQSCTFDGGAIRGILDLRESTLSAQPGFNGTVFAPEAELDLTGSVVQGGLSIVGPTPPGVIRLDGSTIGGPTAVEATMGARTPSIVAENMEPRFTGKVTFANVNLERCRLVGNSIAQMEFTNVQWPTRFSRSILYDEISMRRRVRIPIGNLKEAYQALKQTYQWMGDHARAGDFHYGEMEMRRRQDGWRRRFLSPEFLYWALSGYGTGYIRASLWLLFLAVGPAGVYWWSSSVAFSSDFLKALYFSIQVATLQRPPTPHGLSAGGQWLQLAQTILGPVQIALFALALRMRLKR